MAARTPTKVTITNLALQSDFVGNKAKHQNWSLNECTATFDNPSPDGLNNATKIIAGANARTKEVRPRQDRIKIKAHKDTTVSLFVKKGTADKLYLFMRSNPTGRKLAFNDGVYVDLNTNIATPRKSYIKVRTEAFLDGWIRVIYTVPAKQFAIDMDTTIYPDLYNTKKGSESRAEPGDTMYFWGLQVEQDTTKGYEGIEYVPTGNSPVTVTVTNNHALEKFKSCDPSIHFSALIWSPTAPKFEITVNGNKSIVTPEQLEPGVWGIFSKERPTSFFVGNKAGWTENAGITHIEMLKMPSVTSISDTFHGLSNLKHIEFFGPQNIESMHTAFQHTEKLEAVEGLKWSTVTNSNGAFAWSGIYKFDPDPSTLYNLVETANMFLHATRLREVTDLSEVMSTSMHGMFKGTSSLEFIRGLNTTKATDDKRAIFAGSSVKVPNSLDRNKLISKPGFKFFTQDFEPLFIVKCTLRTAGEIVILTKNGDTDNSNSSLREAETFAAGEVVTFKSWEPVTSFYVNDPNIESKGKYAQHIKKTEIVKGDLISLYASFYYVDDFEINPEAIKRLKNLSFAFGFTTMKEIDLRAFDFHLVTTSKGMFVNAKAEVIRLPDMPNVVDAARMIRDCKNLQYIDNLTLKPSVKVTDIFKSTDIVAPNEYERGDWLKSSSKGSLKASIPYPWQTIGHLSIPGNKNVFLLDTKNRKVPGVLKQDLTPIKNSEYQRITFNNEDKTSTGLTSAFGSHFSYYYFLYPVETVYFAGASSFEIEEPNLEKIIKISQLNTELRSFETKTPKLMKCSVRFQSNLSTVSIESESLKDVANLFQGCGPLTTLNIPTENIERGVGMFFRSTIRSLENYVFPKIKDASYMFGHCGNLTHAPSFPGNTVEKMWHTYYDCSNLEMIGQLKTSKCKNFQLAFRDTPKLLCLKELDTTAATGVDDKGESLKYQIFYNSKLVNPTAAEKAQLESAKGLAYVNTNPCPIPEFIYNLPQQTGHFNLHDIIKRVAPKGIPNVKILNGLVQPSFTFSGVSGVNVTLVNSGAFQATTEGGDAAVITSPIKIINHGKFQGGGGHGGNGGAGKDGTVGPSGEQGATGSVGSTIPEVKYRPGRKYIKHVAAHDVKVVVGHQVWGNGHWSQYAKPGQSGQGALANAAYWAAGFTCGPAGCSVWAKGPCGSSCCAGACAGCSSSLAQIGTYIVQCSVPAGSYPKYGTKHIPEVKGQSEIKEIKARAAIPGCPGGPGGAPGPGGPGGVGGAREGGAGKIGGGALGGHGEYWKHPAQGRSKAIPGGPGGAAPTDWSGKAGKTNDCGGGRHAGGKGGDGTRGGPGKPGNRSGYGGAGGHFGHDGEPGEDGIYGVRWYPSAPGKAGKALVGKQHLKDGSTGLSGAGVDGAVV